MTVAAIAFLAAAAASAQTTMHWTVDGVQRDAIVFQPAVASAHPPLVIAFHGHGGSARAAAGHMQFETAWPEAIVVYPQGLPTPTPIDPSGRMPGWQRDVGESNDRDLKLFDAIVRTFPQSRKIFVGGFSNGAFFSYLLWAQRANALTAIAICAAKLTVSPTTPRAVIHIAGERDPLVPVADQLESMKEERRIDGCTTPPRSCGEGCSAYASATHTPEVAIIHPGGHVYPAWATKRIVQFFRAQ